MKKSSVIDLAIILSIVLAIASNEYYQSYSQQNLRVLVGQLNGVPSSPQPQEEGWQTTIEESTTVEEPTTTEGATTKETVPNPSGYRQISLADLTDTGRNISCPASTSPIWNQINSLENQEGSSSVTYKIPRIIHQTSRTRCIANGFHQTSQKWRSWGWDYYFHDDEAMDRLILEVGIPAFPNLPLVWKHCVLQGAMKADIWRMVLLWEYGGIYVDIDAIPTGLTPDMIQPDDDAFFIHDFDNLTSFHFVAVAPKHPVTFLTVQTAINSLISRARDTMNLNPVRYTGPGALRAALYHFLFLSGRGNHPESDSSALEPGEYVGLEGKKVRILKGTDSASLVRREAMPFIQKERLYRAQNMTHFTNQKKEKSGIGCAGAILEQLAKM